MFCWMAALVWFEIVYAVDLATHALTPVRRVPHAKDLVILRDAGLPVPPH